MLKKTGDRLGPYEIQSALGAGGMGEVYLARDGRLNRRVVLKIVNARLAGDASVTARLRREARAIASLDHPNICTLYEIGQDEGIDYLVMQYLEGETLADLLRRGPVPLERALQLAIDVTSALAFAHRRGVLHRDIKPQNVMILTDGRAKLLDFGVARTLEPGTEVDTEAALTRAGAVLGTVEYMSPEQLAGDQADPRSDVFSLALMIYEIVAGRHPYRSGTAAVTVSGILTREYPHLPSDRTGRTVALDAVLGKGLSRDPQSRQANGAEMLADLERVQREMSERTPPARAPGRRDGRVRTAAAVVAGLAIAVLALFAVSGANRRSSDGATTDAAPGPIPNGATVTPVSSRTAVEYWFDVRDGRNASIQRSLGTDSFARGSKFRMTLTSIAPVFLYLLNDDGRDLSLAYPLAPTGGGGVAVAATMHETDWFGFSGDDRAESLWIVSSADRVAALDRLVPSANPRDLGVVHDATDAASIRRWLALTETRDVEESHVSDPSRVTLSFARSPLVRRIALRREGSGR